MDESGYPYRYTDWYLPLIDAGKSMPDAIGEDAPEEAVPTEGAPLTPTDAMASGGDGIVTEEQVQKGYVWMNEVNNNIFDATYEDIVAYFGVEGEFVKEEYQRPHAVELPATTSGFRAKTARISSTLTSVKRLRAFIR